MKPTPPDALTTAYASNTRGRPVEPGSRRREDAWCPAIERLVAEDHAFLELGYSAEGCLFRGLGAGAADAIRSGRLGITATDHPLAALERSLGVVLVSADLSDAVSVARLWEARGDAAVLVLRAAHFAAQARARRAAVLGFAEPGVVFRYPFLADPIPVGAVALVVVREGGEAAAAAAEGGLTIVSLPAALADRHACEAHVAGAMDGRGLRAARAVRADEVPGRPRRP